MKKKPEIQDFKVPNGAYVNMHNGTDYIQVPLSNLDEDEINMLLNNFEREVRKAAGVPYPPTVSYLCQKCGNTV